MNENASTFCTTRLDAKNKNAPRITSQSILITNN